uniref:Uncharacterized protein n=1 Tax=Fusarium oxysporum (strain Fo5176) TaxID=660025 RepID=A0A0D2YA38_FUSOF
MTRTLHELTAETEFWECHQTKGDGKTCFKINETEDKYRRCVVISTSLLVTENMNCHSCNTKRDKGDIALDKYNRTIEFERTPRFGSACERRAMGQSAPGQPSQHKCYVENVD